MEEAAPYASPLLWWIRHYRNNPPNILLPQDHLVAPRGRGLDFVRTLRRRRRRQCSRHQAPLQSVQMVPLVQEKRAYRSKPVWCI
jgi:hypothetical protein